LFFKDQRPQIETYYDSDANDGPESREVETSSAEPPERDEDIEGIFDRYNYYIKYELKTKCLMIFQHKLKLSVKR
jgi:hypothetical protein